MKGQTTTIADRFELLAPVGRGGMATVHRARDRHLGREVAIKLMRPHLGEDPVFTARFENEARRAASIAHPNVIGIYDFSTDGAAPYIAMELVEGTDLARLIRTGGPLGPARAASIGEQIAAALGAAHALGIVHRDVKPSNVLIGDDGRVRVADFGVAHVRGEDSMTSTGATLGSVEYFSPEQARGEEATPASDLYTLGIVLYEMLTGQRPFRGESPYATAVMRLDAAAPDPRALVRDTPAAFASVVMRAMAPDAADRFGSADELRAALLPLAVEPAAVEPAASVRVVLPVPEHAPAPIPTRPRRMRLAALPLAVAALLGLAVVGAIGSALVARLGGNNVILTEPVGFLISQEPTASPTPQPTVAPTPTATPTPVPTAIPSPTPAPIVAVATPAATPLPAVPAPPPVQAAPPAVVASAVDSPADAVAAWYAHVANGRFDQAYGLWSPRMKGNFPRPGNLDGRWANTAGVTIHELYVAEQTSTTAKVQIRFTETYDAGGSRQFTGWWDLVLIDGRWYLDHPTF